MIVAGFLKVRNEIVREGNLYRALDNLERTCDGGVICDDASTDGTGEHLVEWVGTRPGWKLLTVHPAAQAFDRELEVKQQMLDALGEVKPRWVWWLDGDETLDARGTAEFRGWVRGLDADHMQSEIPGVRFRYTQFWRSNRWARVDDGFDDGIFLKLWRWRPGLSFETRKGTHLAQFPVQIPYQACPIAPYSILHWGNAGKNLEWKGHQYAGGLGGVDRHIFFGHSTPSQSTGIGYDVPYPAPEPRYRQVAREVIPEGCYRKDLDVEAGPPKPFPLEHVTLIRQLGAMKRLARFFTVVIPTFNRADMLPRTLDSLLGQTYRNWVAIVLDDGSTDETPALMRQWQDRDPRIFYARYPKNRGGVAMNEIGMSLACEWTEWWARLGSDDYWGPRKLAFDVEAFDAGAGATWGSFFVERNRLLGELCSPSVSPKDATKRLLSGSFLASWANVAVKCSALETVRERFGNFCDPQLRNMEDFLVNARIATVTPWVWRGVVNGKLVVDPPRQGTVSEELEAVWRCLENVGAPSTASASANAALTGRDEQLTRKLISEMLESGVSA